MEHLLAYSSKARTLWDLILAIMGVIWVFPSSVRDTLLPRYGSFVGRKWKKAWVAQPLSFSFGLFGAKETRSLLKMRLFQFIGQNLLLFVFGALGHTSRHC